VRQIPKDPMAEWFDKARAAEEKIERMLPVINAAVQLVRAGGRFHSEQAYRKLAEEVTRYKP